jgi:hypothetical protein
MLKPWASSDSAWLCTKSRKFIRACKNRITLKALANVSPGFVFETLGSKMPRETVRNPEGVARLWG